MPDSSRLCSSRARQRAARFAPPRPWSAGSRARQTTAHGTKRVFVYKYCGDGKPVERADARRSSRGRLRQDGAQRLWKGGRLDRKLGQRRASGVGCETDWRLVGGVDRHDEAGRLGRVDQRWRRRALLYRYSTDTDRVPSHTPRRDIYLYLCTKRAAQAR